MSEVEKLRALLAEARVRMPQACNYPACNGDGLRECCLSAMIDAALAEPVNDYQRERDEARAEVERLKADLAFAERFRIPAQQHAADTAYKRGAEAMREAAASCVGSDIALLQTYRSMLEGRIRDLPLPEDK